jgi:dienelactone hydrolase
MRRPRRTLTLLAALPLAALGSGCAVRSYALEGERAPLAVPDEVAARFAYERLDEVKLERLDLDEDVARVFSGSVTIRLVDDPEPLHVQFEYWQARSARGPAPTIVITPILGGGRDLALYHCRSFNEAGMHAVLVDRGSKVLRKSWPIDAVERGLRRAVAGRRAVVDWLHTRSDVDSTRLGAFGISMGGILTSVLLAVEPRLTSGVVALAGGDVPSIISQSVESRLVEWRAAKAEELVTTEAEVEALLRASLVSDPARMAPFVDPRRVLFVSTRWDTVVPPDNQELLWRELGRPLRYDLPAGHYTGIVFLPYVMGVAVEWLEQRFQIAPGDP